MADPTIVLASLDDEQLKKSIQNLVNNFKEQLGVMKTETDNAVKYMQQSLQKIGSTQFRTVASSDSGSSVRAKAVDNEAQAAKNLYTAYDKLAGALQMAQRQVRVFEGRSTFTSEDLDKYSASLARVAELEKALAAMRGQIALDQVKQGQFTPNMKEYTDSLFKTNDALKRMNAEYKQLEKTSATSGMQQVQAARQYTEEIKKQAQAIRESEQFKKTGRYSMDTFYTEDGALRLKSIIIEKREDLSVEEQIYQAQQKAAAETARQEAEERRLAAAKQETKQVTQGQYDLEKYRAQMMNQSAAVARQQTRGTAVANENESAELNRINQAMREANKNAQEDKAAYDALNATLQNLIKTYQSLSTSARNSTQGRELVGYINDVQRSMQQIQRTMARPVSFEHAIGLSEKTLDDINYKMQQLAAYRSGLNVNSQRDEINRVDKEYARLQKRMDTLMNKNNQLTRSNNALTRSWNYMKNRLAFIFTVGATTQFIRQLVEVRGQYEMTERALGVLVQSAERGSQIFRELSEQALVSPYTLIELSNAAKQLTAYDVKATEVVETTRRLADMTAAVGIPVERLTYALGQIKAYGYLNARDARMFSNAGIPLVKELAEQFTRLEGRMVSTADIYDRIKKHAIGYADVMNVINRVTDEGGRFYEYQQKMAETLRVRLANLNLAWNNFLNDVGEKSQGTLTWTIEMLKRMLLSWQSINNAMITIIKTVGIVKGVQLGYYSAVGLAAKHFHAQLVGQAILGKKLGSVFANTTASIKKSLTALASHPWWTVAMAATAIILGLVRSLNQQRKANEELNESLRENAKAASESLSSFIKLKKEMSDAEGTLSPKDAEKTWEAMRDEIEKSSASSHELVTELLAIADVNERLSKGFELAQKIQEARDFIQLMGKDAIEVSQDKGWGGMFGEGLVSDLEDYVFALNNAENAQIKAHSVILQLDKAEKELQKELGKIADGFKKFINAYNITDPLQIREMLAAVKAQIIADNPKIKKEYRDIFSIKLDEIILGNAKDTLMRLFLDRLKNGYRHTFQDIDEEWVRAGKKIEGDQKKAIDGTLQYFKDTLPKYADAITKMVEELNNSGDLRIKIGAQFNVQEYTDLQKEVKRRIKEAPAIIDFGPAYLQPTDQEGEIEWFDRLRKEIERLESENEQLALDEDAYSENRIEKNNTTIGQMKALLDLFHQLYKLETSSGGTTPKDPLGDALEKEIKLIGEVQKRYKEYRKMGVDASTALTKAADEYRKSIINTNNELKKFGLQTLSSEELANMTPQQLRDFYQEQIKGAASTVKGTEALEKAIAEMNVEITKIDYTRITEGLNNELGRLKDEYELGVELDAAPELSDVFMDAMGLDRNSLEQLPRDFEGVMARMQDVIDRELGEGRFDLAKNLNKTAFDAWLAANEQGMPDEDEFAKVLDAFRSYANEVRKDETKKQVEEWNKLLEKYAEYEYKVTQIHAEAERERAIAEKKGATPAVMQAIDRWEAQQLAQLSFEEFQKTPAWLTATGDLATLTDRALGMLIDDLEEYKKKAKNLDPKQIKTLNNALRKLRNEQRKDNPFLAIAVAMDEAKGRFEDYQIEIDEVGKAIMDYQRKVSLGIAVTEEETKAYKELVEYRKKLREEQAEASTVPTKTIVESIRSMQQWVSQASGMFAEMFTALGNTRFAETLQNINTIMDKAGTGAAIGAQIGGGYGAIIGAAAGGLMGAVTAFSDEITGNRRITKAIERSERAVKRLELTMRDLEDASDNAYGTMTSGAERAIIANKKLQLVEAERQLQLEKSRKSKKQDQDKIYELEGQIIDLRNEIANGTKDIINNMLGISSAGDGIESLVGVMIDAFRNGEDVMDAFSKKWDEMIDNMVLKYIVSTVFQKWWDGVMKDLERREEQYLKDAAEEKQRAQHALDNSPIAQNGEKIVDTISSLDPFGLISPKLKEGLTAHMLKLERRLEEADDNLQQQTIEFYKDNIAWMAQRGEEGKTLIDDVINALDDYYKYGELAEGQGLSALQQGIQGITETTAGALEAYMNGVSQQVYLHSDLLTQIRDSVVNMDFDIHLATQSQMLLQLQSSYTVQQSIQGILEGVLNPNGQAFNVALIN